MTPSYDHATLFVEPPVSSSDNAASRPRRAVAHEAEDMRRLRNPFAVPPVRPTAA